jgi:isochorismate synthase EntC
LLHKGEESQLVFSEAIAGTTLTSNSDRLLDDPHLLQEHRLVVEDISAQLSPFGRTYVSSNSFQPYPGLMHLRAEIAVEIERNVGPTELITALHPTGALGIIPRQPLSSPLMKKLDPQGCRGVYGAPFGVVLPNGYWKFVVMIRNLMFNQGQARIGSGGGLLTGSTLAQEWAELEAKRQNVKKLLLPRVLHE